MEIINTHLAKTHLSKILEIVLDGKEVIIGKAGKPIAKLVPISKKTTNRVGGQLKGKIKISQDFNKLPKEFSSNFSK